MNRSSKFEYESTLGQMCIDGSYSIIESEFINNSCILSLYDTDGRGCKITCSKILSEYISKYRVMSNGELFDEQNKPIDDLKEFIVMKIESLDNVALFRLTTVKALPVDFNP